MSYLIFGIRYSSLVTNQLLFSLFLPLFLSVLSFGSFFRFYPTLFPNSQRGMGWDASTDRTRWGKWEYLRTNGIGRSESILARHKFTIHMFMCAISPQSVKSIVNKGHPVRPLLRCRCCCCCTQLNTKYHNTILHPTAANSLDGYGDFGRVARDLVTLLLLVSWRPWEPTKRPRCSLVSCRQSLVRKISPIPIYVYLFQGYGVTTDLLFCLEHLSRWTKKSHPQLLPPCKVWYLLSSDQQPTTNKTASLTTWQTGTDEEKVTPSVSNHTISFP